MTSQTTTKSKLNVLVDKEVLKAFNAKAAQLNLRRDAYLEEAIHYWLSAERRANRSNTEAGFRAAKAMRKLTQPEELERLRISMSPTLFEALSYFCDEHRVIRDEFIEAVLRAGAQHLAWIDVAMQSFAHGNDEDEFVELYWSDEGLQQFKDLQKHQKAVRQTIAEAKAFLETEDDGQ